MSKPLEYRRLDSTIDLDGDAWIVGGAADIGRGIDVPSELLDGPVAVYQDERLVAAACRSIDFAPFSVAIRQDLSSSKEDLGVTIRGTANMTIRTETNPARTGWMGAESPRETDFLIVEGPSGALVRIA
jgi:hypothetical protein